MFCWTNRYSFVTFFCLYTNVRLRWLLLRFQCRHAYVTHLPPRGTPCEPASPFWNVLAVFMNGREHHKTKTRLTSETFQPFAVFFCTASKNPGKSYVSLSERDLAFQNHGETTLITTTKDFSFFELVIMLF